MDSNDLTANLYFAAAVRVAADRSMTRLLPLDALKNPLAPHESFSQRILLSLQALGAIQPELSNAEERLMARNWIALGLDSLTWRICWSPGDCCDRRDRAEEFLRDVYPSVTALEGMLSIWEDLALAEVAQYANWLLAQSGYNPRWDQLAIGNMREALKTFSASQVMYLVRTSVRETASMHLQRRVPSSKLGNVFADAIGSHYRRAILDQRTIRGISRPDELPLSTIASMFAYEVTRLDDEDLLLAPSMGALVYALRRAQTLH